MSIRDIGPFEILDRLGAGGMGEVFKARDKRLNRFVAIKFLPESASAAARDRFQREALAIAAFNHPHICTLYEIGEDGGQPFLVMELLEGETLHARLARGAVAPPQAVQWGIEISDALQAAHAKGILHRDLKPGNIFVTPRGIKVLDFGLAGFAPNAASSSDEATLAGTAAAFPAAGPLTSPGATLGTAAYMSPEQARGEPLDARSDLFSLGVVLYQVASGQPPFQGRTSVDLAAAILMKTPPPLSTLRADIPPRLDDIVAQCLEKDPELRFQSASELRVSLKRLAGATSSSGAPSSAGPPSSAVPVPPSSAAPQSSPPSAAPPGRRLPWPAWAALAALAGVAAFAAWRWHRSGASPLTSDLAFRQLTYSGQVRDAAISPDGKFLAHVDAGPQGTSLHLLSVANGSDVQIMPPEAGCCTAPSFSPDGSTVYFVEDRTLKMIPVLGGAVRTIAEPVCSGAGVSPDGKQIAYLKVAPFADTLWIAQPDGTQARQLNDPQPDGYDSRCWTNGPFYPDAPVWSPDGKTIAVERGSGSSVDIHETLVNVSDGKARPFGPNLDQSTSDIAWLPDGSGLLLALSRPWVNPSQVWELRFSDGALTQLTHDLQGFDRVTLAAQAGGDIALVHSNPQFSVWQQTQPGGGFEQLPGGGANQDGFLGVAWMPDGKIMSVRYIAAHSQLWLEGSGATAQQVPVSNLPAIVQEMQSTPDHQLILQGINPGGTWAVYRMDPQGGALVNLTQNLEILHPGVIDGGKSVAFLNIFGDNRVSHQQLWSVPLAGGPAKPVSPQQIYTNFVLPTPDQQHVLVLAVRGNNGTVASVSLNGTSQDLKVRDYRGRFDQPHALTPDGKALVSVVTDGSASNLWAAPLDGSPPSQLTHFNDLLIASYAFARDGRLAISRGTQNSDVVVASGLGIAHGH